MLPLSVLHSALWLHLGGAILGQLIALQASGASLLYLWQRHTLKQRRLQAINPRLPTLEDLEKILAISLWLGFAVLSVTLVSGLLVLQSSTTELSSTGPMSGKILWALLTWSLYLGTLIARHLFFLSWRNLARISLTGFVLLTIVFCQLLLNPEGGL